MFALMYIFHPKRFVFLLTALSITHPTASLLHHTELQLLIAVVQRNILKFCMLCCSLWFCPWSQNKLFFHKCFPCRYSVTRPVETHMSGSSKNLASQAKVSAVLLSLLKLAKFWVYRYETRSGKLFWCSQSFNPLKPREGHIFPKNPHTPARIFLLPF